MAGQRGRRSAASAPPARRGAFSVIVGGFGEILLTVGVLLLLFVVWQLWWTNLEAKADQEHALQEIAQKWEGSPTAPTRQDGEPAAPTHPLEGSVWGILYVPRFGSSYAKPIAEGINLDVLDTVGVGRYPDTQMPGETGNVALAGHRQTHGQVFWDMDKLQDGDRAYLQTREGIYTYTFLERRIVQPSEGDVIFPVPGHPGEKPTRKLLTLTTCHPPFTTDLRMVVHLEQSNFTPASKPAPPAIRDLVAATTGVSPTQKKG